MNFALLYIRVSSKGQAEEGYSLDAQEKLGHEYAHRKGFVIVKQWKIAESAWDRKKDRVAFNQMVAYAKAHREVEHIIFDIPDRMTRNDFDKLKIYELVQDHNKTIHFSRSNKIYNKNSTSDDLFMLDIEVAVAKKMSNDISRKTRMGMLEKAEQGIYPGRAFSGYKNNKEKHCSEIDPERSVHIIKAFNLSATGTYSEQMISNILNKNGYLSPYGKLMRKSTLSYILRNPFYFGLFKWKGKIYRGTHEPLISKTLFDRVQQVLSGKFHPSTHKKEFAFNNLLLCGDCSCKVLGEEKRKPNNSYTYYHCTFSKGRHNGKGYYAESRLAQLFEEPVRQVVLPASMSDWVKEGLGYDRKSLSQTHENRLISLQTQYKRVKDRLSRLYDDKYDSDDVDKEMFKIKENEYNATLIDLEDQIEKAKKVNPNFYEDGIETLELPNLYLSQYVRANYQEKANILKKIASNYTLHDVNISAAYRKPFIFFAKMKGCPTWLPRMDSNHDTEIQNLVSYH